MTTIRLLDARRGLNRKCEELFGNAKIAELIYRFLCDGIEECEDVEPERKRGKWNFIGDNMFQCTYCGSAYTSRQLEGLRNFNADPYTPRFCPNCGSYNGEESDNG